MRSEEVLDDGGIIREVYCVPCSAKCEDKCFCEDTTHEPHARVAHVRDADTH